jgi:hypothetical protein
MDNDDDEIDGLSPLSMWRRNRKRKDFSDDEDYMPNEEEEHMPDVEEEHMPNEEEEHMPDEEEEHMPKEEEPSPSSTSDLHRQHHLLMSLSLRSR